MTGECATEFIMVDAMDRSKVTKRRRRKQVCIGERSSSLRYVPVGDDRAGKSTFANDGILRGLCDVGLVLLK